MASFTASLSTVGLINDDRMSARAQKFRNVQKESVMPSTLFGQPLEAPETPVQEQDVQSVSPATEQKSDVQALIDERQTTRVREVLTRRLAMLFQSFSSGDDRTMYTRADGRKVTVRAFIMSLSTRVVDRSLNPRSVARKDSDLNQFRTRKDGTTVAKFSRAGFGIYAEIGATGKGRTVYMDTGNQWEGEKISSGLVVDNPGLSSRATFIQGTGNTLAAHTVRAQKGRYVPRHTIVEHAGYVSSELWSYALELIGGLTAVQVIGPMLNEGFGRWKYVVKIGRVKVKCEHGDNLITRILWAAGQLATSEHRSKGRNGERTTVQMAEDFDTNEHMEVIKTFDQVDIQSAVKEMYPVKVCPGENESSSDKKARYKHNNEQLAKRAKAVELFSAIKAASIGQVSEIQLSRAELLFMKVLNRSVLTGRAGGDQMVRVDEMHKVTDDMCQRVVDLINRPECTLQWAKAQRDSLMRYCMFMPNGQKFMSVFTNIMRRKDVQEFMAYAADHFGVDGMPLKRGALYDGVPTSSNPETVKMTSLMAERAPVNGTSDLSTFEDCKKVKKSVQWFIGEQREFIPQTDVQDREQLLTEWMSKFPEHAEYVIERPVVDQKPQTLELFRGEKRYSYNPAVQAALVQCREQLAYRAWLSDNRSE